jgi:hypothetical protein
MFSVLEQTTFLGPAEVLRVEDSRVLLSLPQAQAWATVALAFPYQPQPGDTLLVIGQDEDYYVIGVIKGSGPTRMTVPGDLRLEAPHGAIDLVAGRGVNLLGPSVRLLADQVEVTARTLVEKLVNATRWVADLCHLRAGTVHTVAESTYKVKAARIAERADGDVRIDGEHIHLG